MALQEEFEQSGAYLFAWRSYWPLVLAVLLVAGMRSFEYPGHNHALDQWWEMLCLAIAFFGLGIRAYVVGHTPKGTSGRNTDKQVAAVLNTTGLYSVVRHPLYLGNFFCWFGVSLFERVWWVSVIFALVFWLYYERIMFAEEAFLRRKFGVAYETWANRTPAFIPRWSSWRSPSLPFSLKTVLKREYSGFFAIIATFTALEVLGDRMVAGQWQMDRMWLFLFFGGALLYLTLRTLKKRSTILQVPGR